MAELFGFTYFERPNKGEMKKAGNLKYGYERTNGEFIVIFDADFAPHKDFLRELVPYMSDSKIGIVQSPQYFQTDKEVYNRSPLEYGGAYVQEDFYRVIQVSRNNLGGALCCGSNALYRRTALNEIGGTVQIEHSEDAHTGFALAEKKWKIQYLPIILAVGISPDNLHAYFHQQHRWCSGSMSLMLTKKFWKSSLSWKQKLCYITGFLYYLHHPIGLFMSFQLFITLFLYNEYVSFANAFLFYPYLIFSFIILPLSRIPRLKWGCLFVSLVQLYSYSHAIVVAFLRSSVGWISTGTKHSRVSSAFNQTMIIVGLYTSIYGFLLLFAAFIGYLHVFNLNYYSIQFWLFYNMILSTFLFWQMFKFYRSTKLTTS